MQICLNDDIVAVLYQIAPAALPGHKQILKI